MDQQDVPKNPDDAPGWRALLGGDNAGRSLVITGGVAVHAISIYVVATIMPRVVADIGGVAFFAWTATLYITGSLTGASAIPLLLSRLGARRAYQCGFALFIAGSLICSLAQGMPLLLAGRLVQGFGGGMLPALAYATIRSIFPAHLHARAIALIGSVWGVAALLGPSVGGLFAQFDAWRGAFLVDVPIGLAFILVASRVIPRQVTGSARPRAFPGLRLGLLALAAIAVSTGGLAGRPLPALLGIGAAMLLVLAMLALDARAGQRMLPGGAFNPALPVGAVSATMGLLILTNSPGVFIPYLLWAAHGVAPITGGYMSALLALSWTGVSLATASFGRGGARATILAGPMLMLAGLLLHAWALPRGDLLPVALAQLLLGAGIGMGWAHLGALLMQVAPAADRDTAGPFITTTQTLAAVFGSSIAGMLANAAGLGIGQLGGAVPEPAVAAGVAPYLFGGMAIFPLLACCTAARALRITRSAGERGFGILGADG